MNQTTFELNKIKFLFLTQSKKHYLDILRFFGEDYEYFMDKVWNTFFLSLGTLGEGDFNLPNKVWKFMEGEIENREKNYYLKKIDKGFIFKLYKDRDSILGLLDNQLYYDEYIKEQTWKWLKKNGKLPNFGGDGNEDEDEENSLEDIPTTPMFGEEIYEILPSPLKEMVESVGRNRRRKDMFLISFFPTVSILFPNVQYVLERDEGQIETMKSNLYTLIVSKPAGGKSIISSMTREVLYEYKKWVNEMNQIERERVNERNMIAAIKNKNEGGKGKFEEEKFIPFIPIIPGNSTGPSFKNDFSNNGNVGLVVENEMDALYSSESNQWGGMSDYLRSAYHQESISDSRLSRDSFYIENPFLSLATAGTLDQMRRRFDGDSIENGLFSRFSFYYNDEDNIKFNRMVYPATKPTNSLTTIQKLSKDLLDIYKEFQKYSVINIHLTESQVDYISDVWEEFHYQMVIENDDNIKGVLFRTHNIVIKFIMILSCLRNGLKRVESIDKDLSDIFNMDVDTGGVEKTIDVDDVDIDISISLYKVIMEHNNWIYNGVKETSDQIRKLKREVIIDPYKNKVGIKDVLKDLPQTFKKSQLKDILVEKNIITKPRQEEGYIRKLLNSNIIKPAEKKGYYTKINKK